MRVNLKPFKDIRRNYIATFERYGTNVVSGVEYKTILLVNVRNQFDDFVCEHIWLRETKMFDKLKLKKGDKVMFSAVVKEYKRGYYTQEFYSNGKPITKDYRLCFIKNVKKIY